MDPLKISIVTPSFNQGNFIEKTITSVLNQEYKYIEHIIIDAKSSDNTLSILKKYTNQIKWISEKDSGQANAINKGLKMATGDIVTYLNSDDYYLPGTIVKVTNYFTQHPQSMWVTGQCKIVDENENTIQSYITHYKNLLRNFRSANLLSVVNYIDQPSTFWRKQLTKQIGFFDETLGLCLDYDYWLRIIKKYPLSYIPSPLSAFRIHNQSKGTIQYKKQFDEARRVAARYSNSKLTNTLNQLHNYLTVLAYQTIKKTNS